MQDVVREPRILIENHGPDCQCQVIWEGGYDKVALRGPTLVKSAAGGETLRWEGKNRVPLPCLQRLLHVMTHVGEIWSCGVTSPAGGGGETGVKSDTGRHRTTSRLLC